jgi:hypothetical protein
MKPWKLVVDADDAQNLEDPENGWAWFRQWAEARRLSPDPWFKLKQERDQWRKCVLALRSVVARTTSVRPKRAAPPDDVEDRKHDRLWNDYLSRLVLQVTGRGYVASRGGKLPFEAGAVSELCPTKELPATREVPARRVVLRPDKDLNTPDAFWQVVFGSLAPPPGAVVPVVCQTCGKELPTTTKDGKRSWRRICKACADAAWKSKNAGRMREIWRKAKQKARSAAKE